MMKQQPHVTKQIPDYVLGLLSAEEHLRVERHTLTCADCRLALRHEGEVGRRVQATLAAAGQPPADLRQFMPAVPAKAAFRPKWRLPATAFSLAWPQQLVPLTVILLLLASSLSLYLSEQRGVWTNPSPTSLAVTATMTDIPTATITETRGEQTTKMAKTAVATTPSQPEIVATPAPIPTPIAALPINLTSN